MNTEAFYSRLLPFLPGCPEPLIDQAIMDAAAEMAMATQADYSIERPIALVDGKRSYYIFGSSGVEVDLVREVYCGARELQHKTTTQLGDALPNWQTAESSEPTYYNTIGEPGTISVYPLPRNVQAGATIVAVVSWRPGMLATAIPDTLGKQYYMEIVDGAKSKLMLMPGDRKWANEKLGLLAGKKFEDGKNDAMLRALHQGAAGSLSVRARRFGS